MTALLPQLPSSAEPLPCQQLWKTSGSSIFIYWPGPVNGLFAQTILESGIHSYLTTFAPHKFAKSYSTSRYYFPQEAFLSPINQLNNSPRRDLLAAELLEDVEPCSLFCVLLPCKEEVCFHFLLAFRRMNISCFDLHLCNKIIFYNQIHLIGIAGIDLHKIGVDPYKEKQRIGPYKYDKGDLFDTSTCFYNSLHKKILK